MLLTKPESNLDELAKGYLKELQEWDITSQVASIRSAMTGVESAVTSLSQQTQDLAKRTEEGFKQRRTFTIVETPYNAWTPTPVDKS
jgi:hypothetical protein